MSYQLLTNSADPATPASGKTTLYVNSEGLPCSLGGDGVLNVLADVERNNLLRNSGFWWAQRQGVPGSLTTYSNTTGRAICADGWGITNENNGVNYRRWDTSGSAEAGLQSQFYGDFVKATSTGKCVVSQVIESIDCLQARGQTVRLQVWLRRYATNATVRIGLAQLTAAGTIDTIPATFISAFGANSTDPTLGTNLAYIAPKSGTTADGGTISGNCVSCSVTASWQRFGAVFEVPATMKNLVVVIFGNSQFAVGDGFSVGQVSLTVGQEIQTWNPQPLRTEILRVLRYYQKTFSIDTGPAQNAGATSGALSCITRFAAATALAGLWQWRYPVELRVAATTLTMYNPGAANANARRVTGTSAPADQSATATVNSTAQSVEVTCTGDANGAFGDQLLIHLSADAEL